ncbi:MAG: probable DNA primase [Leptospirillum rubarum]|nr:MAG: probable DNA primase [Leptospirillum rubarum]
MNTKKAASADRPCNTTEDILSRLSKVRKAGQGWTACCPAHEDRNQSLSVRITETGRLLAFCHAGCSFQGILEALNLRGERFTSAPRTIEEGPTQEQVEAQAKAISMWNRFSSADPKHEYLTRKKIRPHHARQIGTSLVIPLQDSSGTLWNLQFIHPDGTKRFLRGGMTKGLFTLIGEPSEAGRIYIAEGFATAATVHELTGRPVFVAFSASNLPAVAQVVRKGFPDAEIVLAADADPAGERYSEEAARAVNGLICYAGRA